MLGFAQISENLLNPLRSYSKASVQLDTPTKLKHHQQK
jgi:hypothetical protein